MTDVSDEQNISLLIQRNEFSGKQVILLGTTPTTDLAISCGTPVTNYASTCPHILPTFSEYVCLVLARRLLLT